RSPLLLAVRPSPANLVTYRQRWVEGLLRQILNWGDCEETVDWDSFLWITLRFCSLSRIELAQTMFVIIQREMRSVNMHYVTADDLNNFYYARYRLCPIKSFSSADIDFKRLPLSSAVADYATDFTELVQRFTQLLNPLLHLQQSLQESLPSAEFWESLDRTASFPPTPAGSPSSSSRCSRRACTSTETQPPFRESCDMLAPEALGAEADQWLLRVKSRVKQGGMSQVSVWGEQPPPELFDLLERRRGRRGRPTGSAPSSEWRSAPGRPGRSPRCPRRTRQRRPRRSRPSRRSRRSGRSRPCPRAPLWAASALSRRRRGPPPRRRPEPPAPRRPRALWRARLLWTSPCGRRFSTRTPEGSEPLQVLPPRWMKHCTVAPAPKVWGPDPPLPKVLGRAVQGAALEERGSRPGGPARWTRILGPRTTTTAR
ncbi:unnamed protein product, partial [Prorocentrum cordatum]